MVSIVSHEVIVKSKMMLSGMFRLTKTMPPTLEVIIFIQLLTVLSAIVLANASLL
jgi:hypothetical protein